MIAALYVLPDGVYAGRGLDIWDAARDATRYPGPWPVIAHPPCTRWCRIAALVEARYPHLPVGEDGGTFRAALDAVRRWGGVLEHPAWSKAWPAHDLPTPPRRAWAATLCGGWVTEVDQLAYGHRARKATWLYAVGAPGRAPPPLLWVYSAEPTARIGHMRNRSTDTRPTLHRRQALSTPAAFADELERVVVALCGP